MTRDDIIRIAKEANLELIHGNFMTEAQEKFANLVAAVEREACAELCIDLESDYFIEKDGVVWWDAGCVDCAEAIRARSQS